MKVTFYYKKEGVPVFENGAAWNEDLFEKWDAEISDEQYKLFCQAKNEYKYDYRDIEYCYDVLDSYEKFPEHYLRFLRVNCRALYKAMPEWCREQNACHTGNAVLDADSDIFVYKYPTKDNETLLGCRIYDEDFEDPQIAEMYKNKGVCVNVKYQVQFDRNEFSEEMDWHHVIKYKEYKEYLKYIHENHLVHFSFESMEKVLPKVTSRLFNEIVKEETKAFKDCEDPEDWGDDWKRFKKRGWKITDDFLIDIYGMTLGFDGSYDTHWYYEDREH